MSQTDRRNTGGTFVILKSFEIVSHLTGKKFRKFFWVFHPLLLKKNTFTETLSISASVSVPVRFKVSDQGSSHSSERVIGLAFEAWWELVKASWMLRWLVAVKADVFRFKLHRHRHRRRRCRRCRRCRRERRLRVESYLEVSLKSFNWDSLWTASRAIQWMGSTDRPEFGSRNTTSLFSKVIL